MKKNIYLIIIAHIFATNTATVFAMKKRKKTESTAKISTSSLKRLYGNPEEAKMLGYLADFFCIKPESLGSRGTKEPRFNMFAKKRIVREYLKKDYPADGIFYSKENHRSKTSSKTPTIEDLECYKPFKEYASMSPEEKKSGTLFVTEETYADAMAEKYAPFIANTLLDYFINHIIENKKATEPSLSVEKVLNRLFIDQEGRIDRFFNPTLEAFHTLINHKLKVELHADFINDSHSHANIKILKSMYDQWRIINVIDQRTTEPTT